ncbi:phosphoadenylyl-sulfate reductase [Rickettsiales bacterium]|nr:phosphoadenylyl-sulfate reductase [Rickettsiales bacterium]
MKNLKTKISLNEINNLLKGKSSQDGIRILIEDIFLDKIAYVSSFGAESAIILHMISRIKKSFPVVFINTLKLFQETIEYKNYLTKYLGLQNIIEIQPKKDELKYLDANDDLWKTNTDKCCELRKVRPLNDFLKNYDAWFSGRKSYHSDERKENNMVEFNNKKFIVSPLLKWEKVEIDNYFAKYKLEPHPLVAHSFLSIGCTHCTSKSADLNDVRSGRWKNSNKTECGIHKFKEK